MNYCDYLIKGKLIKKEIYLCKLYNYNIVYDSFDCTKKGDYSCYKNLIEERKQKLQKLNVL